MSWQLMTTWWLAADAQAADSQWRAVKQIGCRMQGEALVVCFSGVTDRTAAEALQGKFVGVPREALPPTARGEYYWAELIGLPVINQEGSVLGIVAGLIESGAHSVLQVRDEVGHERLLPFTAQVVKSVRVAKPSEKGAEPGIEVDWGHDW